MSQRAGGRWTLRDVSVSAEPGELVAIVGASGAGKTMLLDTLAGLRAPAEGSVRYDGIDRHERPEMFRSSLGYVPQDDIIHQELPLRRTLLHAARLRLPAGTSVREREEAVARVLDQIGLAHRADAEIRSLSGGERKRACIAVELLTGPRVFFLDEPTSGLDPTTAAEVIRLLRALADSGTTVVLTTHNVADLDACDTMVLLARDGHLAFTGPVDRARSYFRIAAIADVYARLAEDSPENWGRRFAESRAGLDDGAPSDADDRRPGTEASPDGYRPPPGAIRQWASLTGRQVEILAHNRLTLAILLGSPVAILLMFIVLFRPYAFSFGHPDPNTTMMTVFWLAFGGFFFGLTYGLPQICTELAILRRERLVGLRLGSYVASKLAVLLPLLAVVDAAFLAVLRALDRLPALGWREYGGLFVTLLLSSAAALGVALVTSSALAEPAQATLALPMLCFPQVLFSGAILPVAAMPVVGRWISYAMSNRWTFEGLGRGTGLERLWASGGSPLGPPLLSSFGDTFSRSVWVDWSVLGSFTALFVIAACLILRTRLGKAPTGRAPRRAAAPAAASRPAEARPTTRAV